MIVPFAHSARVEDLPSETQAELMRSIGAASRILSKAYAPDGLNVGANLGRAAGAGFAEHLHFHLVPRWSDDTNFMTVVGELRVIPQHLDRIYEELVPHFQELDS